MSGIMIFIIMCILLIFVLIGGYYSVRADIIDYINEALNVGVYQTDVIEKINNDIKVGVSLLSDQTLELLKERSHLEDTLYSYTEYYRQPEKIKRTSMYRNYPMKGGNYVFNSRGNLQSKRYNGKANR